jgi:amidase
MTGMESASAMLRALRTRQVSSVELMRAHLDAAARTRDTVNVLVWHDGDRSLRDAAEADRLLLHGDRRPLAGLPLTLKESIALADSPVTLGEPSFLGRRAAHDATVVTRLREAGAVLLGKTNLAHLLNDWQTANPVYGRTNNPLAPGRTAGGSSGGAAAVAAGVSPLDIGTDLIGSVRMPAAFCGVTAHRPSDDLVPTDGQVPDDVAHTTMSVYGLMARVPEDLLLGLEAIAGPVAAGVRARPRIPAPRASRLRDFRVALLPLPSWFATAAAVASALEGFGAALRAAGAEVRVTQPDCFGDLRDLASVALSIVAAETHVKLGPDERRLLAGAARRRQLHLDEAWAAGVEDSAGARQGWTRRRLAYRAALRSFFAEHDVLVAPITMTHAFPHLPGTTVWPSPLRRPPCLAIDGVQEFYGLQAVYPAIASVPGHCATTLPVGVTADDLPLAVQIVGPYMEDATPIAFARLAAEVVAASPRPAGRLE